MAGDGEDDGALGQVHEAEELGEDGLLDWLLDYEIKFYLNNQKNNFKKLTFAIVENVIIPKDQEWHRGAHQHGQTNVAVHSGMG